MEAGVAHGSVAAEANVHDVGAAFNLLRQLAVLKCANQMTVAVRSVVDVQEVIVGLNAKTERKHIHYRIKTQFTERSIDFFFSQFTPPKGLVQPLMEILSTCHCKSLHTKGTLKKVPEK